MVISSKELLKDETLAKKLITKGFWVYFFAFFTAPIGYLLRMLVSDTLTVAEVGIFYSVLGLVGLIATYNDLGLTEALMYFIPKYWIKGEKAKARLTIVASFVMQMLTGLVIFCGLYFGAEWLATVHFHDMEAIGVLRILAFYFLGYNIIQLCSTIFVAFQDTFAQGLVTFVQQISNLIFTVIFWLTASLTLMSYSVVWIIGTAVGIMVGVGLLIGKYRYVFSKVESGKGKEESYELKVESEKLGVKSGKLKVESGKLGDDRGELGGENGVLKEKKWRWTTLKQHFQYALWVFLVANVANLLGQVDQQVVVNVLGAESAGLFSNFQALLMVFIFVVTPLFGLMFPVTTELITKKDTKKFGLLQQVMYTYFGAFALMISGFFVVFGQEISVFLFGEGFRFSGYMLQFAAPCLVFNCWATISMNILAGLGKIKQRLGVVAVALGVNLLLNLIFLILLGKGLVFSAVILSVSWVIMAMGAMWVIKKEYPFRLDWKFLVKNIVIVFLLGVLMYYGKAFLEITEDGVSRWKLLWVLLVSFVGYGVILAGMNWKKIRLLLEEVRKLKRE